ncbi:MAG: FimB/Mfa2 family fimbrial subunit, partial [Duncaniella sp.]|nr:FimB/Mfa2 family fimbrial subunit [Duncaniella sp.]
DELNIGIYDRQGNMVFHKLATRELTTENSYFAEIDVKPGQYDIIAWCEGPKTVDDAVSFELSGQTVGSAKTTSGASISLISSATGVYFNQPLRPLFYGSLTDVEFPDSYGTVDLPTVSLIKDTNRILVQLQNMDGQPLDPSNVSFELEARNSKLNSLNSLSSDVRFSYRPWYVSPMFADTESRASLEDGELPSGVQAEFSTGRILAGVEQWLTVKQAQTGNVIFRIPMVQYLLMVRGYYEGKLSAQDYLDACDNYSMVFFIDENYTWLKSHIYINNWRVVPPQDENL